MCEQIFNVLKNIHQIAILVMVEKWWETHTTCQLLICSDPFVMCGKQMVIYGM
jgi:hypothetical protein